MPYSPHRIDSTAKSDLPSMSAVPRLINPSLPLEVIEYVSNKLLCKQCTCCMLRQFNLDVLFFLHPLLDRSLRPHSQEHECPTQFGGAFYCLG